MAGKVKCIWEKYYKIISFLSVLIVLIGAVAKPMVWPGKVQSEIEELKKEDVRIRKSIDKKADQIKVEGDQALLKKDIEYLKEGQDDIKEMLKFMYQKSGGKLQKGD